MREKPKEWWMERVDRETGEVGAGTPTNMSPGARHPGQTTTGDLAGGFVPTTPTPPSSPPREGKSEEQEEIRCAKCGRWMVPTDEQPTTLCEDCFVPRAPAVPPEPTTGVTPDDGRRA